MELPRPTFTRAISRQHLPQGSAVGERHTVAVHEEPHHRAVEFRLPRTGVVQLGWPGPTEQNTTVNGQWMKRRRWKASHFVRADDQRPRHLGNEVGQAACGCYVTIDEDLETEPTGIDTCERCEKCRARTRR